MTWYSLVLAEDISDVSEAAWQLAWEVSQEQTNADQGNAIFRKAGAEHRLVLFFTPSARLLAESFGASPCAKPSAAGMSVVAGSERARQIHFGGAPGLRQGLAAFRAFLRLRSRASERAAARRYQP